MFRFSKIKSGCNGCGFRYPAAVYSVTKDFDWSEPNNKLLLETTAKYGTPHFSNHINRTCKRPFCHRNKPCALNYNA